MSIADKYEVVIGLEVHAQLDTKSKLFCGDSIAFGAEPNTHVSAITLGHPGTLPKTNKKAIEYAIKMGIACDCTIERYNYFARKNYFYPDLPKGYQVSQHTIPICNGGHVLIKTSAGTRYVKLNRIHLEEDAGKSIHDIDDDFTCIDYNRAGTALIEIVTEPDLHSAEEAYQYITEVRKLVRWLNICDGNMEEGSLRCDANVSVRLKGALELGTKVEVKNLNSIRNVKRAIEIEAERMIGIIQSGGKITQQTRSFDADNDTTFAIRDKEEANDYRYFAEPDLPPFHLSETYIDEIRKQMPALPDVLMKKYQTGLGLSEYDAALLCQEKTTSAYFELVIEDTSHFKAAANWMIGPVKQYLNESKTSIEDFPLQPSQVADLVNFTETGKVSFSVASTKLMHEMIAGNNNTAQELATALNLLQVSDTDELAKMVQAVLDKMPLKVEEYRKGKKGLIGLFVGEVKKMSKGKADAKIVTTLLEEKLNA